MFWVAVAVTSIVYVVVSTGESASGPGGNTGSTPSLGFTPSTPSTQYGQQDRDQGCMACHSVTFSRIEK